MQYVRVDPEKIVSEHEEDFMEEAEDKRSSPGQNKQTHKQKQKQNQTQ